MATSKEKEKEEEITLEEFRSRQGFIPYYSDTFFEEISNFSSEFPFGIVFGIGMLYLLMAILSGGVFVWHYFIMLGLGFAYLKMRGVLWIKMKRFGYQMQEDEIILTVWGKREVIPYTEIQRALMTKPVKMTIKDIQVPYSHGYIRFPYEVGIAKQQKNIMECYEVLRKTVSCEMPTMTKENISYFDKMYAYNSSFRNSCFWLCLTYLFIFGCNVMQADEIFDLVVYVVPVIVQCGVLAKMAKSVRLGARNVEEMQQNLTKYPGTDYILKYRKNWQFILAAMVVIGLNFVIVWWCWM